jgi:hypothetical protein
MNKLKKEDSYLTFEAGLLQTSYLTIHDSRLTTHEYRITTHCSLFTTHCSLHESL